MRVGQRRGFTMIEIIVAMAVAVILLVCVHSTVQAMSHTAKRIQEIHADQARLQRFLEILRRDLKGWYEKAEGASPNTNASAENAIPFLRFTTTSDGLEPSGNANRMRAGEIQYILRRTGSDTEVVRSQTSSNAGMEVVVWRSRENFTVEFEKNKAWVAEWGSKERPDCVKLVLGMRSLFITP